MAALMALSHLPGDWGTALRSRQGSRMARWRSLEWPDIALSLSLQPKADADIPIHGLCEASYSVPDRS